jgi:methyl-accepting chemotaxis protein
MYPWHLTGHKIYQGVLTFQCLLTVFIGVVTDSILASVGMSLVIAIVPMVMLVVNKELSITRHIAAIATQLFVALHIQLTMGLTYIHFEIFVMLAVTTIYRDWKVVASSVVVVAVHHIGFYALQSAGGEFYIFEENFLQFSTLLIHALFAIAEGVILVFIAVSSQREGLAARELSRTIHQIMKNEGTFNMKVPISDSSTSTKEFGVLISAFATLVSNVTAITERIFSVSTTLDTLTNQVNEAAGSTSDRVSTIASAIEQMSANNESVADNAQNVGTLSSSSKEASARASKVVADSFDDVKELQSDLLGTSTAIESLSEQCHQIEKVMASITAISEQTNLLALNAAIESARAGEHGRGFAVVADEVRQLALRTKDNTHQISEITSSLIQGANVSVERMKACVDKAEKVTQDAGITKATIDTVLLGISKVSDNIQEVSTAIREQTSAATEISSSTTDLADTSSQLSGNALLAEENFINLTHDINALKTELERFT